MMLPSDEEQMRKALEPKHESVLCGPRMAVQSTIDRETFGKHVAQKHSDYFDVVSEFCKSQNNM